MEKDLSVIYNGKLLSVKESLNHLKELNFDTSKIEKAIAKIEENVEKKVAENYEIFDQVDSKTFLHDSLASTYSKATSKLDKIKFVIEGEYKTYFKINAKYKSLSNKVEKVDENNIDEIIVKAIELLDEIRKSSTIDYKMEKSLVENIYALYYQIIKLELIYKGTTLTITKALTDETDCAYFAKLAKENIEKLSEEDQKLINKIIVDLAADGLEDSDYLNTGLLKTIITSEDSELTEKINSDFLKKYDDYEELNRKYEMVERENAELTTKNQELKKDKKQKHLRKLRKRIFLNINGLLIAAGILTSGYVLKDRTSHEEYKTTTTTYNSITEKTNSKETYEKERSNDYDIEIIEYTPWDEPGYFRDEYERRVYKYNLSGLETVYEHPEEYLTEKIKDNIEYEESTKTQKEKPKDFGYTENKYVVTEIKQDKDVYNLEITPEIWVLSTLTAGVFMVVLDYLISSKLISKISYKERKEDYKKVKKELTENSQKLLEQKDEIASLALEIINSRKQLIETYESLPEPVREIQKIKKRALELKEKNNNS